MSTPTAVRATARATGAAPARVDPAPALRRAARGRMVSGVAAGVAEHLGLAPVVLRVAFLVLTFAGGVGLAVYAVLWVFVPEREDAALRDAATRRAQLLAVAVLGAGAVVLLVQLGAVGDLRTMLPLGLVVVGVALVWRQADPGQRASWRAQWHTTTWRTAVRAGAGALLLLTGLAGFLASRGELGEARRGLVSTVVVVIGLAVLTGPSWVRMTSELQRERRERIRSQERADLAAHVHDSVLQTLALIQKAAQDPREVTRLARVQERELRSWLYRPEAEPEQRPDFAAALEQVAAEVEEAHRTPVEVVVVGDCPVSGELPALLAAAREAVVNACKHSGAEQVQVYAEVEPAQVAVFVRDRGRGFEPDAVPADRYGLAESVVGRMQRHGGRAAVRSAPGEGTEVRLEVARA